MSVLGTMNIGGLILRSLTRTKEMKYNNSFSS